MQVNDVATIMSISVNESMGSSNLATLITLLTTAGGSDELTEELFILVNTTAEEFGLAISQPLERFGELHVATQATADCGGLVL